MPLTATTMRLVMRQISEIESQPIDNVRVHPSQDLSELHFELDGPEGTPFSEGRFHISLVFDSHYPEVPPKGCFRTKIFHPNVSERGDICVNALKKDWNPHLGLRHVLLVIRCLLVEPNPESALNEEAARLLLEDYAGYERKACMLTGIYAKRPLGVPRITYSKTETEERQNTGTKAAIFTMCGVSSSTKSDATESTAPMQAFSTVSLCQTKACRESCALQQLQTSPHLPTTTTHADLQKNMTVDHPRPLRSLEGNACFMGIKIKDDDVVNNSNSANNTNSGAVTNGMDAVCATAISTLQPLERTHKKIADKKKTALKRI